MPVSQKVFLLFFFGARGSSTSFSPIMNLMYCYFLLTSDVFYERFLMIDSESVNQTTRLWKQELIVQYDQYLQLVEMSASHTVGECEPCVVQLPVVDIR